MGLYIRGGVYHTPLGLLKGHHPEDHRRSFIPEFSQAGTISIPWVGRGIISHIFGFTIPRNKD